MENDLFEDERRQSGLLSSWSANVCRESNKSIEPTSRKCHLCLRPHRYLNRMQTTDDGMRGDPRAADERVMDVTDPSAAPRTMPADDSDRSVMPAMGCSQTCGTYARSGGRMQRGGHA